MSSFDPAFDFLISNENGYVDDPSDAGGATNCGISLRFLRSLPAKKLREYGVWDHGVAKDTIEELTKEQAKKIYAGEFWGAAPFSQIDSQRLANYIFDMSINMGVGQSVKLVQRALWACVLDKNAILDDGVFGYLTLKMINQFSTLLIHVLPAERAGFYRLLCEQVPRNKDFLNGWLNRAYKI
jgi:lysozyme family protein